MVDSELYKALYPYFPKVEALILEAIPADWGGLEQVLEGQLAPGAHQSHLIWPLAAAVSVGGDARAAIPVSASNVCAWIAQQLRAHATNSHLTDTVLQEVGPSRIVNYAHAIALMGTELLRQSAMPWDVFHRIQAAQLQSALLSTQGLDLQSIQRYGTVRDYWQMVEATTAANYATALLTGALAVTDESHLVRACAAVGHHLGMAVHFCNDLAKFLRVQTDAPKFDQQIILPVVYGLNHEHPHRMELAQIVLESQLSARAGRVLEILCAIDAKAFVQHLAMQELKHALDAAQSLPSNAGSQSVVTFLRQLETDAEGLDLKRVCAL